MQIKIKTSANESIIVPDQSSESIRTAMRKLGYTGFTENPLRFYYRAPGGNENWVGCTVELVEPPEYAIIQTRHFYGPTKSAKLICAEDSADIVLTWPDRKSAREWIDQNEAEPYWTAHNESGHPDYSVVTVGSRRYERAVNATFWQGHEPMRRSAV